MKGRNMPCTERAFRNKRLLMIVQDVAYERRLGLDSGFYSVSTRKQLRIFDVIP